MKVEQDFKHIIRLFLERGYNMSFRHWKLSTILASKTYDDVFFN